MPDSREFHGLLSTFAAEVPA